MGNNTLVAIWSWVVISILLEVTIAYALSGTRWYLRDALEGIVAIAGATPLALIYMGLLREHRSIKMFALVAVFFSADLLLIWSASLAH